MCDYAPQVECGREEKEIFWQHVNELLEETPRGERVVMGAVFNGHVGDGKQEDQEVMGKYGFGQRNDEGQRIVDFAKSTDLAVVNTYYKKKEEHRVTYKSELTD